MGFMDMAKQVRDLQKARAALAAQSVTGTSGRGAVTIEMNGAMQVKAVKIDPEVFEKKDAAALEKLVLEAMNDAVTRAQKVVASQFAQMGGLGGLKLG